MKATLRSGRPAIGLSVMIPSPQIVEMAGRLGFDWVLIDCEHGTINRETVELMAMAAQAGGTTPIARPATNSPDAILQVLEAGALGVQVPHVSRAEQARGAVAAVKYHPLGARGLAAGTRPAGYGFGGSAADYVEASNRETLVCAQIEDPEGVANLREILAVPGLDVFFVGPSDLAQAMGYPGRTDAPEVRKAIDGAFRTILAAGKIAGTTGAPDAIPGLIRQGIRYTYTHLTRLLAQAGRDFLRAAREAQPE
ncbi:MAG TPA: aldolase/citrate lyase family protein [bacterium]|nr:aldolase/citrate lyase family protein [bacterium]